MVFTTKQLPNGSYELYNDGTRVSTGSKEAIEGMANNPAGVPSEIISPPPVKTVEQGYQEQGGTLTNGQIPSPVTPVQATQPTQSQPSTQPSPVQQVVRKPQTYTVKPGDTLSKISQQFNTPLENISGYRSGNPNIISPGEVLTVGEKEEVKTELPTYETPLSQNTTAYTGTTQQETETGKSPMQNVIDTYREVYNQLGLGDVKTKYEKVLKEQESIQKELNDKIDDLNNNPWISSGSRSEQVEKLKDRYASRLNVALNTAKLYESILEEGKQEAQFLVGQIQEDTNKALELAEKKQTALDKLAEEDIHEMDINGRKVLVDYKSKKVVADLGVSKVTSSGTSGLTDYQQTQAFIGISNKFQADNIVNQAIKGQTAVAIANQVIANPKSATNQLKSLYSLVKNLDPDSAVREGEISLANQTTSYLQRFKTSLERINSGQVINPEAAKALAQATVELASAWNDTAQRRIQQYQSQASTAGIGTQFNQYLGGFQVTPQSTQIQVTDWMTDYNYERDIEQARQAIQQGADESAVRTRLLAKYKKVNL